MSRAQPIESTQPRSTVTAPSLLLPSAGGFLSISFSVCASLVCSLCFDFSLSLHSVKPFRHLLLRSNWSLHTRTTQMLNTKCQKWLKDKPFIEILGLEMYVKGQRPNNSVLFCKINKGWSESYPSNSL